MTTHNGHLPLDATGPGDMRGPADHVRETSHHRLETFRSARIQSSFVDGVGNYCSDITEPGRLTDNVNPLARESESYYRFKGAKLHLSPRSGAAIRSAIR
jgi:hypothetical protein